MVAAVATATEAMVETVAKATATTRGDDTEAALTEHTQEVQSNEDTDVAHVG